MTESQAALRTASYPQDRGPGVAWFCLRSQPRHEHIAAGHLCRMDGVDVFNPRIRFSRSTRHGRSTVTESMFPNYLFARFDWMKLLNRVHYAPGVSGVVHFGDKWPIVPDAAIAEVRGLLGGDGVRVISNDPEVGESVELAEGAFRGLTAVITRVMPGSQRVTVLLDFLGRQTPVEFGIDAIIHPAPRR